MVEVCYRPAAMNRLMTDEQLILYVGFGCPFCVRVTLVIEKLGIEVETRDVWKDPESRSELVAAQGRATVPVLRCINGLSEQWIPESADIIRYLRDRFEKSVS